MQKITGDLLAKCWNIERNVQEILAAHMPAYYTPRVVEYEYCNATQYAGECRIIGDKAVIRLSKKFKISTSIISHELIHAFMPEDVNHGHEFMRAMRLLHDNGIKVERFAHDSDLAAPITYRYMYRVSAPGRAPFIVKRQRKTYTIKYLEENNGRFVEDGRTFELLKS